MPYKPDQRQYRMFSSLTAESGEKSAYTVRGYATTFDDPYDFGPEGCKEVIRASALYGADMSDVIFQLNHEGVVMARMRNDTLRLEPDEHGLGIWAYLGGIQAGRDLFEGIANGLIDRMSWGFVIAEDGWEWDPDTRTSTITRISKVFDVSAVSMPANEGTEIHARSYLDGVIEAEQQELLRREREQRQRAALKLRLL